MRILSGRYALLHVDAAGTMHRWTTGPASAHWVARWHARDSGYDTAVLTDDGAGGWRVVCVWTATGEPDPAYGRWDDDPDIEDDNCQEDESWPECRSIINYLAL